MRLLLCFLAAAGLSVPAQAEVTNTADNGFTTQHQTIISAPAKDIWKTLIAPSRWWNGDHSWTGNADNFYLVAQAGGCFCELIRTTSEDNIRTSRGSVQHMRVVYAHQDKMLRMTGALGPLQSEAVTGTLSMELKPLAEETIVRFTYKVGGYMEYPIDKIAPAVDGVIGEQLTRLAALFIAPPESDDEEPAAAEESEPDES